MTIAVMLFTGMLPLSVSALSPRAQDYYKRVVEFIKEEITTREKDFFDFAMDHNNKWKINPLLEELKVILEIYVSINTDSDFLVTDFNIFSFR